MNIAPKRTEKNDWMSDLLARKGYYVSGHSNFSERLGLPKDVVVVIRHFRLYLSTLPEVILLTLEWKNGFKVGTTSGIQTSEAFKDIQMVFPSLHILSFSPDAGQFELDTLGLMNGRKLQEWFSSIDNRYLTNQGRVKPINVSSNDGFADWTRANLTPECVINDFDGLLCPTKQLPGVLIELKRPKQDIRYWSPYRNDRGNYQSVASIAKDTGLENRTIAYNIDNQAIVALHKDVVWNAIDQSLHSYYCVLPSQEAIAVPLENRFILKELRSRN